MEANFLFPQLVRMGPFFKSYYLSRSQNDWSRCLILVSANSVGFSALFFEPAVVKWAGGYAPRRPPWTDFTQMLRMGQSRHLGRRPTTSGLPPTADITHRDHHFRKVPQAGLLERRNRL